MPQLDARNLRRSGRVGGGSALGPIEALERREVLSYSALGVSLPDLTLTAEPAPIAAWGGSLTVTVDVYNRGASTLVEPLNLTQGAPSSADSPPTKIEVIASTKRFGNRSYPIGEIEVPAIRQNDLQVISQSFNLPARPPGFPGVGGKIYLTYVINPTHAFLEDDFTNNVFVSKKPVLITPALPDLRVVGFQTPVGLQPGDVLKPSIRIANFGSAPTGDQGPLIVQIVASQDKSYGPGDTILATYAIDNILPISNVPGGSSSGDAALDPAANVITLDSRTITLPNMPGTYFLGVKVNPLNRIREQGNHSSPRFDAVVKVGPPLPGLPPGNAVTTPAPLVPVFPFPLGPDNNANAGATVGGVAAASFASSSTTVATAMVPTGPSIGTLQGSTIRNLRYPANRRFIALSRTPIQGTAARIDNTGLFDVNGDHISAQARFATSAAKSFATTGSVVLIP